MGYVLSSALDFFSQLYCSITEDCFLRVLSGVNVHTRALPFPGQSATPQAPRSGGQGLGWTGVSPLAELRGPCKHLISLDICPSAALCMDELRPGSWSKSKELGISQAGKLRDFQVKGPQEGLHPLPWLQDPRLVLPLRPGHAHKGNGAIKSPTSHVSKHLHRLSSESHGKVKDILQTLPLAGSAAARLVKRPETQVGSAHRQGLGDGTQEGTRPATRRGRKACPATRSRANILHRKAVITVASIS